MSPSSSRDGDWLILNVNDSDETRYLITRYLQRASFRVIEASDGAEAIRQARTMMPDLVVLDVKLPDISGFLVAQSLRDNPITASVPILHASAFETSRERRLEGLASGSVSYMTQPVDEEEFIATVRALLRNRDAERKARRGYLEWQSTFDAIGDAACVVDSETRISQANAAMGELLGRSVADIAGKLFADVAQPVLGPLESLLHIAARGEIRRSELRLGERWFRATADRMFGNGGAETGVVLFLSDVTLQRRVEEHRDKLYLEAQTANRAKDEFLAVLSHELRTPLNAILGWLHLIQSDKLPESSRPRALETVARNARQQQRLIEDVLDVSRIISGKVSIDLRAFPLDELVLSAVEGCQPAAAAKGVELTLDVAEPLGTLTGDPERLHQVLTNLLSNAVKFSGKGGRVQAVARSVGRDQVTIAIHDNGRGIPAAFLPHVFDRFRQADSTTTRLHGGLGLGLAIVRYFVELHGGSVRAESPGEGLGATFVVELPRVSTYGDMSAARSEQAVAGRTSGLTSNEPSGKHVLVVDDEADARELVGKVLELHGASVSFADSAESAMVSIESRPPNVIVSDIGMPHTTGFELLRQIRSRGYARTELPAVALTAFARSEDGQLSLDAGFDLHLSKPVEPDALAAAVIMLSARNHGAAATS